MVPPPVKIERICCDPNGNRIWAISHVKTHHMEVSKIMGGTQKIIHFNMFNGIFHEINHHFTHLPLTATPQDRLQNPAPGSASRREVQAGLA